MHKFAYLTLALAGAFAATAAFAQATRPLDALSACRLDESRVALRFTFEGGACQEPGEASLLPEEGGSGIGIVTVPTTNVGDVCTMQIVPVQFEGVVEADQTITSLDITLLNPEGSRQSLGSTDVVDGDEECVEPETEAAE